MPAGRGGGRSKGETLEIKGAFDGSGVSSGMKRMGTDWSKEMRKIDKASQSTFHGTGRHVAAFFKQQNKFDQKHNKLLKEAVKEQGLYNKKVEEARKRALGMKAVLKDAGRDKGKRKAAYRGMKDANADLKGAKKGHKGAGQAVEKIQQSQTIDKDELRDSFFEAAEEAVDVLGEGFIEPFKDILRKDVPGAIKSLTGGFGKMLKGGGNLLQQKADKSKAAGGGGGAMASVMGKLAGTMKTLGPILQMAGGAIAAIVQLLLDAEAGAKEFNKNILSTAGSSEFLHKNMKNTVAAGEDLEDTLNKIRGQATSLDNLDWGINKETHTAVLNAITAEGKSLKSLQDDFDRTGKAAEGAAGYAKDWGSMVQMSVAYSRAFGVSLQEVSQLEGEMMTELGSNLTDVEKQFQYMTVGAEEAGIATNKFFNIIRSFSADLTLFTIRMEDITKVMMALGKAMSPRDAQKFLQGITGFFKNQGLGERTKAVVMGGGAAATNARLQKSMDQKLGTLASDIADATGSPMDVKHLKVVLRKSDKELADWLAKDGEKLSDDQKKAIRDAAIQQQKLMTNNPVDTASALADIDPFDTMEQLEAQSMSLFGKKLDQLTGVERLGAESALGVSDEQQKGFRKLNMGVEQMQADLAHKLEKGLDLTDAETDALRHLGIDATSADAAQSVREKKAKEVWNAMSADQQSLLQNGKQEIDYQKETSKYQTSAMDKLGILVDFVMNQIYTIMSDTYDGIMDLYDAINGYLHPIDALLAGGAKKSRKEMAKDTKSVQKSGNMELIRAWGKSQGDLAGVRAELQKGSFGKFGQMADKQVQKLDELQKKLDDPKTPDDQKELLKQQIMFAKLHLDEAKRQTILNISSDDQLKVAADTLSQQDFDKLQKTIAAQGFQSGDITEDMKKAGIALDPKTLAAMEKGSMKYMNLEGIQSTLDNLPKLLESMNPPETQIGKLAPNIGNAMDTIVSPNSVHVDVNDPEKIGTGGTGVITPADDQHDESQDAMDEQAGTLDNIYKALRIRGIKLDKPFLNSTFKKVIKEATYESTGDALEDFYMLMSADKDAVQDALKKGLPIKGLGHKLGEGVAGGKSLSAVLDDLAPKEGVIAGHAMGTGPMGIPRPAPGEVFVSAKPGEHITPRGGGGQVITLQLKGDLGRIIDAHADDRISHGRSMQSKR